jgi:hypothetical protein
LETISLLENIRISLFFAGQMSSDSAYPRLLVCNKCKTPADEKAVCGDCGGLYCIEDCLFCCNSGGSSFMLRRRLTPRIPPGCCSRCILELLIVCGKILLKRFCGESYILEDVESVERLKMLIETSNLTLEDKDSTSLENDIGELSEQLKLYRKSHPE